MLHTNNKTSDTWVDLLLQGLNIPAILFSWFCNELPKVFIVLYLDTVWKCNWSPSSHHHWGQHHVEAASYICLVIFISWNLGLQLWMLWEQLQVAFHGSPWFPLNKQLKGHRKLSQEDRQSCIRFYWKSHSVISATVTDYLRFKGRKHRR